MQAGKCSTVDSPEMTCVQLRGMIILWWLVMAKVGCASDDVRGALHLASACTGYMHRS